MAKKEIPVFLKESHKVRQYVRDALQYARTCSYREEIMGILMKADEELEKYENRLRRDFKK